MKLLSVAPSLTQPYKSPQEILTSTQD
jgi:hypothetical protein